MRRSAVVALLLVVGASGCSDGDDTPAATTTTAAPRPVAPAASVSGISVLPNGNVETHITLEQVRVADDRDVVVSLHPGTTEVTVRAPDAPPDGEVRACLGPSSCRTLLRSGEAVGIGRGDGLTHLDVTLRGTWPDPVVLDRVDLTYEAVDEYFGVRFVP